MANSDEENHAHKVISPVKYPDDTQKLRMLSKSVEIMIIAGMENHVYKFENELKKQVEGGPIGLALTGEVADCYLIGWDKKFLNKLESLRMIDSYVRDALQIKMLCFSQNWMI